METIDETRRRELEKLHRNLGPVVPLAAFAVWAMTLLGADVQEAPARYAAGQFPEGTVYQESDLPGLVGANLPEAAYLVGRFVYLGLINGRQLFSTYRPGLTDPNGIAFGNVLVAVTFHGNLPPGLQLGRVIVSAPSEPLNLVRVGWTQDGQRIFVEAESRSLPVP